ncbi:hypothetical protein [Candidatus Poriferisodalis sp.]|uniref:hypothetical protein n=1 Tax=Candidatus Poriferisodalis sp. TaxID=3101277 RepID=UPI003B0147FF
MAKNRPRTPATRVQVELARSHPQAPRRPADRPAAPAAPGQPNQDGPQGRLWADNSPEPRAAAAGAAPAAASDAATPPPSADAGQPPRAADGADDRRPRSRYAYMVTELEHVVQLRRRYDDLAEQKKQAHDDWLAAVHNAASNGVKLQDIAAESGVTRSGLYQTLSVWRRRHGR